MKKSIQSSLEKLLFQKLKFTKNWQFKKNSKN